MRRPSQQVQSVIVSYSKYSVSVLPRFCSRADVAMGCHSSGLSYLPRNLGFYYTQAVYCTTVRRAEGAYCRYMTTKSDVRVFTQGGGDVALSTGKLSISC